MLLKHIDTQNKYLLAVSGGVDSMVLCDVFLKNNISFAVAHCNFQLRNEESEMDEALVKNWCEKNGVSFFVKKFDTKQYADQNRLSIQVAARGLRYGFFLEILENEKYNYIATAHHQDDNIETTLFHFFRGTGLLGLTGIPVENNKIVRPLLKITKEEILQYAALHQISWREDSSNQKQDYTRNKLRNHLIPQLEAVIPNFKNNIAQNIKRLGEAHEIYAQQINQYRKKLLEQRGKDFYIPVLKLKNIRPLPTILYEILKPFQFTFEQSSQVINMIESESGRKVENEIFSLLKNRNFFIISTKNTLSSDIILLEKNAELVHTEDFELKIKTLGKEQFHLQQDENICQIDAAELCFPLLLRKWRQGDYMYPLGMKKKKKIARILIDLKIPMHEKEHIWVIESKRKIVWLVGLKTDERFKIDTNTKEILLINLKNY